MSDTGVSEQDQEEVSESVLSTNSPIILMVLAILLVGTGTGWWIHPGAGLLSAGLITLFLAYLLGSE